ncbi:Nuclear import receptor [Coemansia sp. RSA 1646]|nr:Nuclear import receptor [Coemansia sp. RSA 1646]KAJ2212216.1 Nuclear import receptor [Coemansia sp. RSA 487]
MSNQQQSVSEVINALNSLYQGSDLTEAWTTSDAILGTAELGPETKVFAAQTLRNKIINDFSEIGEQGALSLRDSLVTHLRNARRGPQPLITQLCLSLADLAVQLGAWTNPFVDMTSSFLSDPESVSCLLEFLAVLPEEVLNERIVLTSDFFRQRSNELLTNRAGDLIQLLVQCLQQTDLKPDTHTRVLVCFTSWLKNGEITLVMVQNTPLLELAFAALKADDDSLFDTAVDAVCGIIYETRSENDDDPNSAQAKNATVERVLVPQLNGIATQMRGDQNVADGDEERIRGYCRIFAEAGDAWVQRMVLNMGVFEGLVSALVDCMRLESLDAIAMLFDFWNNLADRTLEYTASCDPARRSLVTVFETIIDIIIIHLKYPATYDTNEMRGGMTAKERDEFREFRHNIGDVLKDCVCVVGQSKALLHPYNIIVAGIEGNVQLPWQDIEAALFALRAMGAEISPSENEMLPKIMDMFARFPPHPKLRYAATLVIGRYTEWTYEHPQYVQFQLNYIAEGFKMREVAAASAQSLKFLCQDCARFLAEHWADLLKFFNEIVSSNTLDEGDVIEFSEALAHVVSAVPEPSTSSAIESFCMPVGQELGALLQKPEFGESEKQRISLLLDRLGVFLRFLYVENNEPAEMLLSRIINESWPLVNLTLQRLGSDTLVSESVAKFVRVLVEFYPNVLRPIVPQVVDAAVAGFQQTGLGIYLWLGRRILNVHHNLAAEESISLQLVTQMVEKMSEAALALFQGTQFSDIPETTEDYFRLVERAVETAPGYIINMLTFPYVFQAAIAALEVNQFHAQLSVINAWSQILNPTKRHIRMMHSSRSTTQIASSPAGAQGAPPPSAVAGSSPASSSRTQHHRNIRLDTYPVEQIVDLCVKHGFDLSVKLLYGLMRQFDREAVSDAADVLTSLTAIVSEGPLVTKAQFDAPPLPTMCEWVQAILSQVPDNNYSAADKQALLKALDEHIQGRHWLRVKAVVNDFAAAFWRRNLGNK